MTSLLHFAFFRSVFDWTIDVLSDDYAMIDTGTAPIASIMAIGESGLPLGVCHFVLSKNCVADAQHAVELGGQIAVERSEVPDVGAWTDTVDPWLNEVAFWEPDVMGSPDFSGSKKNTFRWVEIGTPDFNTASAYYTRLLGWRFSSVEGMTDYGVCTDIMPGIGLVGGERGAALRGMTDYISVDNLEETCNKIRAHGGTVVGEPIELGDGGLFALFLDPDQNRFGIVQAAKS